MSLSWLKKAGSIALKATAIAAGVQTTFASEGVAVPAKVADALESITNLVVTAESFGQMLTLDGPSKARGIAPAIGQVLLQTGALKGRKINDPELFMKGCTVIGGGVADVLNALE